MNANLRNFALWVIIVLLLLALFTLFQNPGQRAASQDISFSQLLSEVDQNHVRDVVIQGQEIRGTFTNGSTFQTYAPNDPSLVQRLYGKGVQITARPQGDSVPWFVSLLVSWLPFIALIGVWIFLSRQMQGAGGKALGFGKSRAKLLTEAHGRITFEDVAGVDEAKSDLSEIVEFLRDPGKFQRLGGKIPRGVLLVGPPGTGKTLIARAVAGEANVPFFTISGSDFVEMFVGVGAARVRDTFNEARKRAPCIVFMDEIDAVGRKRGAGLGNGNDEREQTLNQLLVEMDGFDANDGVILIAATNRPDILDPALLRPGRFDREVIVAKPDLRGREQILAVHLKNAPLDGDVDLRLIARNVPGFSGAELRNLVNEAALLATLDEWIGPALSGVTRRAALDRIDLAEAFRVPLMIHMGQTVSELSKLFPLLKRGDIVTHMFAPPPNSIIDTNGRILPEVLAARKRGVFFDLGNGRTGHLRWDMGDSIMKAGFLPDTFPTDWTPEGRTVQIFDFPNVISKFLLLGMRLDQIIACATVNPAKTFPAFHDRGTLRVGAPADVAILDLRKGNFEFVDNFEGKRKGSQRLFPVATVLAGKVVARR